MIDLACMHLLHDRCPICDACAGLGGFAVTLVTLALLAGVAVGLGRLGAALGWGRAEASAGALGEAGASALAETDDATEEHYRRVAAIAAVIAVVGDRPQRVVSVARVPHAQTWGQEGRRQHFQSHRLR